MLPLTVLNRNSGPPPLIEPKRAFSITTRNLPPPLRPSSTLVVYFINTHTFVAPNLARGEARGRECIRSDTRPTEQRSHGPNWAQPTGRHVFWPEALLLAPCLCPKSIAANVCVFMK